jgi:hypothetical protein
VKVEELPFARETPGQRSAAGHILSILHHSGVTTVEQLRQLTDEQLCALPPAHEWGLRIGVKMLERIRAALEDTP